MPSSHHNHYSSSLTSGSRRRDGTTSTTTRSLRTLLIAVTGVMAIFLLLSLQPAHWLLVKPYYSTEGGAATRTTAVGQERRGATPIVETTRRKSSEISSPPSHSSLPARFPLNCTDISEFHRVLVNHDNYRNSKNVTSRRSSRINFRLLALSNPRGATVACYPDPDADIVCDQIAEHGEYEPQLVTILRDAIVYLKTEQQQLDEAAGGGRDILFIDVGSNVGVFSLPMWRRDVSVLAIDASATNVQFLTATTRCLNPVFLERAVSLGVTMDVVHAALGTSAMTNAGEGITEYLRRYDINVKSPNGNPDSTALPEGANPPGGTEAGNETYCALLSTDRNIGDGRLVCNEILIRVMTQPAGQDRGCQMLKQRLPGIGCEYHVRDWVPLQRLDSIVMKYVQRRNRGPHSPAGRGGVGEKSGHRRPPPVVVMKLDIEGSEWEALKTAPRLLAAAPSTLMNSNTTPRSSTTRSAAEEAEEEELMTSSTLFDGMKPRLIMTEVWSTLDPRVVVEMANTLMKQHGYVAAVVGAQPRGGGVGEDTQRRGRNQRYRPRALLETVDQVMGWHRNMVGSGSFAVKTGTLVWILQADVARLTPWAAS